MHTLRVRRPRPELRPYVRTFAQRHIDSADPLVVEAVPAQLEQLMTFELGIRPEIWHRDGRVQVCDVVSTAGAQSRFAAHMHLFGGVETFGIFFQPTAFRMLFGFRFPN